MEILENSNLQFCNNPTSSELESNNTKSFELLFGSFSPFNLAEIWYLSLVCMYSI